MLSRNLLDLALIVFHQRTNQKLKVAFSFCYLDEDSAYTLERKKVDLTKKILKGKLYSRL